MRVPSGAYRPPTQSGEIERNRQKIDVLSRRQQRLPKIPPPVAAGGGITGITRASVWSLTTAATATRVLATPAGAFDIETIAGEDQGVTQSGTGLTVPPGIYLLKMDVYIAFDSPQPVTARPWIDYDGSQYHYPMTAVPVVGDLVGGSPDFFTSWSVGPVAVAAPGSITFGASWPGAQTGAYVNYWSLDISRAG